MATATLTRPETARPVQPTVARFFLTLHVENPARSAVFWRAVLGVPATKQYTEYAEFTSENPSAVVSLLKVKAYPGKPIQRLGVRFADEADLVAAADRLSGVGAAVTRSPGRVAAIDPDGNRVELVFSEPESVLDNVPLVMPTATDMASWAHGVCSRPCPVPHADSSLDVVHLQASFNGGWPTDDVQAMLADAWRALRPGGRVVASGLVGDRPSPTLSLPGMVSRLKSLPAETEPLTALEEAGFEGVYYEQLGDIICFRAGDIDLRKFRLHGTKPYPASPEETVTYRGPFAEVEAVTGLMLRRGEPTRVAGEVARVLREGPAAGAFLFGE